MEKNECILLSLPNPLTRQISPIAIKWFSRKIKDDDMRFPTGFSHHLLLNCNHDPNTWAHLSTLEAINSKRRSYIHVKVLAKKKSKIIPNSTPSSGKVGTTFKQRCVKHFTHIIFQLHLPKKLIPMRIRGGYLFRFVISIF